MTRIRLYEHPLAVVAPRELEVPSLAVWLMDHYGDTPAVQVQIFAGEPSMATEITGDIRAILAGTAPEYVILQSPGDPISWTLTTWLLIGAAVAVATVLLMPKPVMPGNINRTQASPNNALGNRENKVRMLERVEDIFGTVKSIPSLMMPTYNKYIGHKKVEYGYYCVGRGYYDIAQIKDGETLIADISRASASVYAPFTSPNSGTPVLQIGDAIIDDVITAARAIEVDGITLKALNQVQLPTSGSQYSYAPGGVITQSQKQPNFNAVCSVGDEITVVMDDWDVLVTPAVYDGADPPVLVTPADYDTYNYSGTYTIASVDDGTVTVSGSSWPVLIPADLVTEDPPPETP